MAEFVSDFDRLSFGIRRDSLFEKRPAHPDVEIEFESAIVGSGPRVHIMMCCEPGGIRIEFIGPGV
jgi:hypothetical protein